MQMIEVIAAGISLTLIHVCRLLGVAFVVKVSLEQLTELVKALQSHRRKITAYQMIDCRWHMTVENATKADVKTAMQEQERWNIRIPPPPKQRGEWAEWDLKNRNGRKEQPAG